MKKKYWQKITSKKGVTLLIYFQKKKKEKNERKRMKA